MARKEAEAMTDEAGVANRALFMATVGGEAPRLRVGFA